MSTWAEVRTAIRTATIAALPAAVAARTPVDWASGAAHVAAQRVLLDIIALNEEHIREQTVDDVDLYSAQRFTVQFRCESQHDTATIDGLWLLTLVTMGLRRALVRDAARTAGVVLLDVPMAPRRVAQLDQNGRKLSVFACDISFRAVITLDTDDPAFGLIEHVEVGGEAEAPGGSDTIVVAEVTVDDPDPSP